MQGWYVQITIELSLYNCYTPTWILFLYTEGLWCPGTIPQEPFPLSRPEWLFCAVCVDAYKLSRSMYPSIFNSFSVIRTASAKKLPFSRIAAHIFVSPGDGPATITQYVPWMERQFNACQTPCSMYLCIFTTHGTDESLNTGVAVSFTVKLEVPAQVRRFIFLLFLPHFCFPLRHPWGNHLNVVRITREFDAYKLSRSMYPSIFNSFSVTWTASAKNRRFHVPQPTFLFPLETTLWLSRNVLYGWKDNSMLAKPLAACTYLSSIVSELYDA